VKAEAARQGAQINGRKNVSMDALEDMLQWLRPDISGGGGREEGGGAGDWVEEGCTWARFKAAVGKAEAKTGVGEDGWSAYLLRRATEATQRAYYEDMKVVIRERTFPEEWLERIAMLQMKQGEHPANLGRRRDLWIEAHGCKLMMRMLGGEYERACGEAVPGSQGGFTAGIAAPGRTLVLRAQKEQCEAERTGCYRLYVDLGVFFMSCVRQVQERVERWCGVRPEVTDVVMALHGSSRGRYETAYGVTSIFELLEGNPQGCTQSPARSKLQISLIQGAVRKLCKGLKCRGAERRAVQIWWADDGAFCTDDLATLQQTLDVIWVVTRIGG